MQIVLAEDNSMGVMPMRMALTSSGLGRMSLMLDDGGASDANANAAAAGLLRLIPHLLKRGGEQTLKNLHASGHPARTTVVTTAKPGSLAPTRLQLGIIVGRIPPPDSSSLRLPEDRRAE